MYAEFHYPYSLLSEYTGKFRAIVKDWKLEKVEPVIQLLVQIATSV